MLEGSFALGNNIVKVLQFLFDVLKVNPIHLLFEFLNLEVYQLFYLGQTTLDLEKHHVVPKVSLHICVLAQSCQLELTETGLQKLPRFINCFRPGQQIRVRVGLLALNANLFIVIAQGRPTYAQQLLSMSKTESITFLLASMFRLFLDHLLQKQIIIIVVVTQANCIVNCLRLQEMEQLMKFEGSGSAAIMKDSVIQKEEYGTLVDKEKKKKKKKNKERQRPKDIDEDKIKQLALTSEIHQVAELNEEEKTKYSIAQNHPLKIICTNLPFKITLEELFQYFNTVIAASNPELASPLPIKDVQFDKTKNFAVMTMASRRVKDFFRTHPEFVYIEGTTTFKMVKPKDFFQEKYIKKNQLKAIGGDNKLYLGGLPLSLGDEQVKKICLTFGKLKFFNLVREGSQSKGYCFLQFEEHKSGEKAMKALNNLPIANQKLKCHYANLGGKGLTAGITPATNISGLQQVVAKPANSTFGSYLLSYQNITNIEVQMTLKNQQFCKIPSRVVQFLNMCYPQDLYDQDFVEDLQLDVAEECKKFGPIDKVVVPRPDSSCGYSGPCVGKVFCKFMYIIHAKKARQGLSGRVYNKRTVVTSYYPEQKFNLKEYLVSV